MGRKRKKKPTHIRMEDDKKTKVYKLESRNCKLCLKENF